MKTTTWSAGVALGLLLACADAQTAGPELAQAASTASLGSILGTRFVTIGTSITMGTRDDGVVYSGQSSAWPAQLAAAAGVPFAVPGIQTPGCPVPQATPLSSLLDVQGNSIFESPTCAPLLDGVTLPTQDLAIQNALTSDALFTTPEIAASIRPFRGKLYSRVLPAGATQVSAMASLTPSFVGVELGGVEVVRVLAGNADAAVPEETWEPLYDQVIAAVVATGAPAVLVGFWQDVSVLPFLRTGAEVYARRGQLAQRYIAVSTDCAGPDAANLVNVGNIPLLAADAEQAASSGAPMPVLDCANVPGEIDNVFTPAEVAALNARMNQTNAYIAAAAAAHGFAYFTLDAVYTLPKPEFSVGRLLDSDTPFGSYFSSDGIHPSARGHGVLASAAAQAILAAYGADALSTTR